MFLFLYEKVSLNMWCLSQTRKQEIFKPYVQLAYGQFETNTSQKPHMVTQKNESFKSAQEIKHRQNVPHKLKL